MKRRKNRRTGEAPKKVPGTLWTDICRLLLYGIGIALLCFVTAGIMDEERDYPLAILIIGAVIGLGLIALGLFAKPKTAKEAAEGINF